MAGVLANISARNPEPREGLLSALRRRPNGGNRRLDGGPRLVIEVGPARARQAQATAMAPTTAPAAAPPLPPPQTPGA
jgi:hypothetical protein